MHEAVGIINNSPIWHQTNDPNDPTSLCASDLLTQKQLPLFPPNEETFESDLLASGPSRWRRVQHLTDQFWKLWRENYLSSLQPRSKWLRETKNIKVGDLVILNPTSKMRRNRWQTARIIEVKTSEDGLVRSGKVVTKTSREDGTIKTSVYERPIGEMVILS